MSERLIIFSPSSIFGAYLLLRSLGSWSQFIRRLQREESGERVEQSFSRETSSKAWSFRLGTAGAASRLAFGQASCGCADAGRLGWAWAWAFLVGFWGFYYFFRWGGKRRRGRKKKKAKQGSKSRRSSPECSGLFGLGLGVRRCRGFYRRGLRLGAAVGSPGAAGEDGGGAGRERRGAAALRGGARRAERRGVCAGAEGAMVGVVLPPQVTAA